MEHDSLDMLGELESSANRVELNTLFRDQANETRQQIANLERCFQLLGEEINDSPSPTTKGLAKEGKSAIGNRRHARERRRPRGALETEHYETAVYETLITNADARGAADVAQLLRQNLEQEKAAIEKIKKAAHTIANEGIAVPDAGAGDSGVL
ncbi:MAG: ferritin-like domain-containing protein [Actinomycetota bacterium]|nr:ferritin-like domain-containing protein [Actinomycetota bacterium]